MITHNCCAQHSQNITIKCVCFCSESKSIPCMFWFHGIFLTFTEELVNVRNTSQAGFWITVLFGWTSEGRTWCVKPQCKRQCNACSCGPYKHNVRFGWMHGSNLRVWSCYWFTYSLCLGVWKWEWDGKVKCALEEAEGISLVQVKVLINGAKEQIRNKLMNYLHDKKDTVAEGIMLIPVSRFDVSLRRCPTFHVEDFSWYPNDNIY